MINALTSIIHLGKHHRTQRYETKSDSYHGETKFKKAKSKLLRPIRQILHQPNQTNLKPANTCICRWRRCTHSYPHRKDYRMQRCKTLITISTAMKYRVCADLCSLHRTQQILQGSKLISFESNLCIVVVVINALTSIIHLGKRHRTQQYEAKSDSYHGETKFIKAKSQLLRSIQQIVQSTKSDQLEAFSLTAHQNSDCSRGKCPDVIALPTLSLRFRESVSNLTLSS